MSSSEKAMEDIWQSASEEDKNGQRFMVLDGLSALAFIYLTGFVDVKKHGFQDWVKAFKGSLQKNGSYLVTHEQWLAKKKFRYEGPVGVPFDPESIEEKEYPEKELVELLKDKIIPNTVYGAGDIPRILNGLKAKKRLVGGKMRMDRKAKDEIIDFINKNPSPSRVREVLIKKLKRAREAGSQKDSQQSRFTAGSAAEKIVQGRLSEISKALGAQEIPLPDVPTLSIKDMQKKRIPPGGGRV